MARCTLSVDDQAAVDILLDHAAILPDAIAPQALSVNGALPSANVPGPRLLKPAAGVSERRLGAVRKVLELLQELPAIDPPADLLGRTLARVDEDIAQHAGPSSHISTATAAEVH
jgi:hypothetical protein